LLKTVVLHCVEPSLQTKNQNKISLVSSQIKSIEETANLSISKQQNVYSDENKENANIRTENVLKRHQ